MGAAQDWLAGAYLWIKALHVAAVIAWMAGIFYLPRLFVYHAERARPGGELSSSGMNGPQPCRTSSASTSRCCARSIGAWCVLSAREVRVGVVVVMTSLGAGGAVLVRSAVGSTVAAAPSRRRAAAL